MLAPSGGGPSGSAAATPPPAPPRCRRSRPGRPTNGRSEQGPPFPPRLAGSARGPAGWPFQSVTAEEIVAHCRGRIAGYKIPKRVEFRDELARTATGKIQKFKLREAFWSDSDRQVN